MSEPSNVNAEALEPVQPAKRARATIWTTRLIWFLRSMAAISLIKGLYHWKIVCGIGEGADTVFANQSTAWQSATVFFAVIDLFAAVGLWLAAAWGAVVWLTAAVSMAAVQIAFPQIYGTNVAIVAAEFILVLCYLGLAILSAREHPH